MRLACCIGYNTMQSIIPQAPPLPSYLPLHLHVLGVLYQSILILAIPVALALVIAHSCASGQLAARLHCMPQHAHEHHTLWRLQQQHDRAPERAAWHALKATLHMVGSIMDWISRSGGTVSESCSHGMSEERRGWTARVCAVMTESCVVTPALACTCAWLLVAWATVVVVVAAQQQRCVCGCVLSLLAFRIHSQTYKPTG